MLDYIKNIAVFIIVEGVILRLITNEDYKKIVRMCAGMIMIILVLSPLDTIIGFTDIFRQFFDGITGEETMEEIQEVINMSDIRQVQALKQEYETLLRERLGKSAAEYGYRVESVTVEFDEGVYNYIGSVSLVIAKEKTETGISGITPVERVEIGWGGESVIETESPVSIMLKNHITDVYGVAYERIAVIDKDENEY